MCYFIRCWYDYLVTWHSHHGWFNVFISYWFGFCLICCVYVSWRHQIWPEVVLSHLNVIRIMYMLIRLNSPLPRFPYSGIATKPRLPVPDRWPQSQRRTQLTKLTGELRLLSGPKSHLRHFYHISDDITHIRICYWWKNDKHGLINYK